MFNNSGKKVKTLAKVIFWLILISFIVIGIILIATGAAANSSYRGVGTGSIVIGIIMIPFGVLLAWLSSIVYYAIGVAANESENNSYKLNVIMKSMGIEVLSNTANNHKSCQNCHSTYDLCDCYIDTEGNGIYEHYVLCKDCYEKVSKPKKLK